MIQLSLQLTQEANGWIFQEKFYTYFMITVIFKMYIQRKIDQMSMTFLSQNSISEDKEATSVESQGKNIVTQDYCPCERKKIKLERNGSEPCNKQEEEEEGGRRWKRERNEGRKK